MASVATPWGICEVRISETVCPACGCPEHTCKPLESNRSIQVRCAQCGKWLMNAKYDRRSRDEIRKERIRAWATEREEENERILREGPF